MAIAADRAHESARNRRAERPAVRRWRERKRCRQRNRHEQQQPDPLDTRLAALGNSHAATLGREA
jgi:hypothetical protein